MQRYDTVDSDQHVLEPADLWEQYIDPQYRDICPKLIVLEDGSEVLRLEGDRVVDFRKPQTGSRSGTKFEGEKLGMGRTGTFGTRALSKQEVEGIDQLGWNQGRRGGFDTHVRIADMDAEGIDAAFVFPTLGTFLGSERDADFGAAAARAYNRYLAEHLSTYPERLFGFAVLPLHTVDQALAELKFARETLNLKAAVVMPSPKSLGGYALHDPALDPVWAAAQDLDIAIGIHGGGTTNELGLDRFKSGKALRHLVSHTFEMMAAAASMIMGGPCERHPGLRVGFMEASGGWMAGWLDRMDRHYDDPHMNDTPLSLYPSEIFQRQCFIAFEPVERCLLPLADYVGPTNILWGSDYPHADGFPGAPKLVKDLGLSPDTQAAVLAGGAKRFYGLP